MSSQILSSSRVVLHEAPAAARFRYIDTIRGVAALGVVYFHLAQVFAANPAAMATVERGMVIGVTRYVDLGKICVILFFFVSGMVIPGSLLRPANNPIRDFAIGRIFRMYPAYWLSLPAGIVGWWLAGIPVPTKVVIANMTMMQQFIGITNVIGVYWTLQIELIFYGLCVLLLVTGWLSQSRKILLCMVVLLLAGVAMACAGLWLGRNLPMALPLSLAMMMFGLLWRRHVIDGQPSNGVVGHALVAFVVLVPATCLIGYRDDFGGDRDGVRYLFTYVTALLLFVTLTTSLRVPWRITAYLGTISYSIYLFGAPISTLAERFISPDRVPAGLANLYIGVVMLITIAVSALTYRFVEKPGIAAGKRLASALDRGRSLPQPKPNVA